MLLGDELLSELRCLQESTAVPPGWWYDGNAYVDIKGTRRQQHPSCDIFVGKYLEKKNAAAEKYNRMLREAEPYL